MDYHVFKKPKIKNGKKIYKWYYYYTQIRYYHSEIGTPRRSASGDHQPIRTNPQMFIFEQWHSAYCTVPDLTCFITSGLPFTKSCFPAAHTRKSSTVKGTAKNSSASMA